MINSPTVPQKIVSIKEAPYYTHYSFMKILLSASNSPKSIISWRYSSLKESEIWREQFKYAAPEKTLFFYAFLDEMRFIVEDAVGEKSVKTDDTDPNKILMRNLRLVALCVMVEEVLGSILIKEIFENSGEGGDAIRELVSLMIEYGKTLKTELFWESRSNITLNEYMADILKMYISSDFMKMQRKIYKESKLYLRVIKGSSILDKFFSIFGAASNVVVGQTVSSEKERNIRVIFFKDFPLWCSESGDGSFFSLIFTSFLDAKHQEFILFIERIRVYLLSKESEKENIRDATLMKMFSIIADKKNTGEKFTKNDASLLSQVLMLGGSKEELRTFFNLVHNRKILEDSKISIEKIVEEEMLSVYETFNKESDEEKVYSDEESQEIAKVFLMNIAEKITFYLSEKNSLLYDKNMGNNTDLIFIVLSTYLKDKLNEERENSGWLK